MFELILTAVLVIPCYLLWCAIHEVSHYVAAKYLVGGHSPQFKLYPHKFKGHFFFASVRYTRTLFNVPSANNFLVSMAPRLPGLAACLLTGYAAFLNGIPQILWLMFVGAGAVDYLFGLTGRSEHSDLQRAARVMKVSPWVLRGLFAPPLIIPLLTVGYILYDAWPIWPL